MSEPVRYRFARSLESYEPFAFLLAWPVLFLAPWLGWWNWGVAFTPYVLIKIRHAIWRALPPIVATPERKEASFDLVGVNGKPTIQINYRDVEALTAVADKATQRVRLDRKDARSIIFDAKGETPAALAERLGLDSTKLRSRYWIQALIAQRAAWPVIAGFAMILWSWLGSPDSDTLRWMNRYTTYIFLPLVILLSARTQFDIGRDGVAWRWLFIRKYVPFSEIDSVNAKPFEKPTTIWIVRKNGEKNVFAINKQNVVWQNLHGAFGKYTSVKDAVTADAIAAEQWLARTKGETSRSWTERLRAIASSDGGYRGVSVGHLWSLAENLDHAPMIRAAALFALVNSDSSRERTRVLATQIVDPNFAALLNALASGASTDELGKLVDACHWF